MGTEPFRKEREILIRHKKYQRYVIVIIALSILVAAMVTISLIKPAVTMSYICGHQEHIHSEECYSLICDKTADIDEETGEETEHVHSVGKGCYDTSEPVCGEEEHIHNIECEDLPERPETAPDVLTAEEIAELEDTTEVPSDDVYETDKPGDTAEDPVITDIPDAFIDYESSAAAAIAPDDEIIISEGTMNGKLTRPVTVAENDYAAAAGDDKSHQDKIDADDPTNHIQMRFYYDGQSGSQLQFGIRLYNSSEYDMFSGSNKIDPGADDGTGFADGKYAATGLDYSKFLKPGYMMLEIIEPDYFSYPVDKNKPCIFEPGTTANIDDFNLSGDKGYCIKNENCNDGKTTFVYGIKCLDAGKYIDVKNDSEVIMSKTIPTGSFSPYVYGRGTIVHLTYFINEDTVKTLTINTDEQFGKNSSDKWAANTNLSFTERMTFNQLNRTATYKLTLKNPNKFDLKGLLITCSSFRFTDRSKIKVKANGNMELNSDTGDLISYGNGGFIDSKCTNFDSTVASARSTDDLIVLDCQANAEVYTFEFTYSYKQRVGKWNNYCAVEAPMNYHEDFAVPQTDPINVSNTNRATYRNYNLHDECRATDTYKYYSAHGEETAEPTFVIPDPSKPGEGYWTFDGQIPPAYIDATGKSIQYNGDGANKEDVTGTNEFTFDIGFRHRAGKDDDEFCVTGNPEKNKKFVCVFSAATEGDSHYITQEQIEAITIIAKDDFGSTSRLIQEDSAHTGNNFQKADRYNWYRDDADFKVELNNDRIYIYFRWDPIVKGQSLLPADKESDRRASSLLITIPTTVEANSIKPNSVIHSGRKVTASFIAEGVLTMDVSESDKEKADLTDHDKATVTVGRRYFIFDNRKDTTDEVDTYHTQSEAKNNGLVWSVEEGETNYYLTHNEGVVTMTVTLPNGVRLDRDAMNGLEYYYVFKVRDDRDSVTGRYKHDHWSDYRIGPDAAAQGCTVVEGTDYSGRTTLTYTIDLKVNYYLSVGKPFRLTIPTVLDPAGELKNFENNYYNYKLQAEDNSSNKHDQTQKIYYIEEDAAINGTGKVISTENGIATVRYTFDITYEGLMNNKKFIFDIGESGNQAYITGTGKLERWETPDNGNSRYNEKNGDRVWFTADSDNKIIFVDHGYDDSKAHSEKIRIIFDTTAEVTDGSRTTYTATGALYKTDESTKSDTTLATYQSYEYHKIIDATAYVSVGQTFRLYDYRDYFGSKTGDDTTYPWTDISIAAHGDDQAQIAWVIEASYDYDTLEGGNDGYIVYHLTWPTEIYQGRLHSGCNKCEYNDYVRLYARYDGTSDIPGHAERVNIEGQDWLWIHPEKDGNSPAALECPSFDTVKVCNWVARDYHDFIIVCTATIYREDVKNANGNKPYTLTASDNVWYTDENTKGSVNQTQTITMQLPLLPSTGGTGAGIFMVTGTAAMTCSLTLLLKKRLRPKSKK